MAKYYYNKYYPTPVYGAFYYENQDTRTQVDEGATLAAYATYSINTSTGVFSVASPMQFIVNQSTLGTSLYDLMSGGEGVMHHWTIYENEIYYYTNRYYFSQIASYDYTFIETIQAEDGTYIDGQINSDGYYYVKGALVFPPLKFNIANTLKTSTDGWVNIGGVLKHIEGMWTNIGGVLKKL